MAVPAPAQKSKKKTEDEMATQTLPVLKDPPPAVAAETDHLVFHLSPLSGKGLLSQQVRDALKALLRDTRGATIVKLRAFVAGTGDMRRVPAIVSEVFTEHKLALPAVSTIAVGALPLEGAQVVIESIAVDKRAVNPNGLAFYSGRPVADLRPVADVLHATCFLSSLDDLPAVKPAITAAFPGATVNFVQLQRLGLERVDVCEAVSRLESAPAAPIAIENGVARVHSPKIVMTGIQMAFRSSEADFRLAFDRLGRVLEPLGTSNNNVFWASTYTLTRSVEEKVRAFEAGFFPRANAPAGTILMFEALPSLDAAMAVDVMAAAN